MHEIRLYGMHQACPHGMHGIGLARLEDLTLPRISSALAESEGAYQLHQMRGLLGERLRRSRKLFGLRGVRLRHLIHLRHRGVHLLDAGALFLSLIHISRAWI